MNTYDTVDSEFFVSIRKFANRYSLTTRNYPYERYVSVYGKLNSIIEFFKTYNKENYLGSRKIDSENGMVFYKYNEITLFNDELGLKKK